MAVQVYGCNHVVIEVTDAKKAARFYHDVFGLKMLRGGKARSGASLESISLWRFLKWRHCSRIV